MRRNKKKMWNRKEIKEKGKESFKKNYWNSVLAALIYTLFFSATSAGVNTHKEEITNSLNFDDPSVVAAVLLVLGIIGTVLAVAGIVHVFLINPIETGCARFFIVNQDENATISEIGHPFKNNYINVVVGLLLRNLIIGLGLCLFIVPGVILSFSYRMVPFILAEDPNIGAVDALKKSRAMMNGHKWNSFVYDLSFILWDILAVITCGIVNVFYVAPYKKNADAQLYRAIRG